MASKFSPRLLALASTLALAAGCSQILGLGDYDIDPKLGGDAGEGNDSSGAPGDGGMPGGGSKPSGGEPPSEGGRSGEPAVGGSAGEPATGGAGGSGPEAPFLGCNGEPFEGNDAIIRSCILRVGCQPWAWPTDTISRCVSQNAQATYEGTTCTLDAQSCDDITACEGLHIENDFCDDQEPGMYCNGDEIVTCSDYPHAKDCAKYGGTCHDFGRDVDLDGFGTTVACALPLVTSCTATTGTEECGGPSNAYAFQCEGEVAYGSKCSNFAASCQDIGGDVGCYYPVNTCTTEEVTCANGRATWCDGASKAVFDCASVGLGCATEGDYTLDNERQCTAPGCTAADIITCKESCDGSNLTICYGGAPVTVDCKDYGFADCFEYDYTDSNGDTLCSGDAPMNDCVYVDDEISFAQCE